MVSVKLAGTYTGEKKTPETFGNSRDDVDIKSWLTYCWRRYYGK